MTDATVETRSGRLRGQALPGVRVWRGIPYASPPIGALRFRAPVPATPWAGVRDATEFGPICPQPSLAGRAPIEPMDEDCLYLNVWAPASGAARRPVMVFIHAGAYYVGSGSNPRFDGARLSAAGDVVVVTINYRLGPLGFLDPSGLHGSAGRFETNLGLRDQIAALRWVADNIGAFGGDPGNITLFGQSAGGGSVACLVASPLSEGLFHAAIIQSGPIDGVFDGPQAAQVAEGFFAQLEWPDLTFDDLLTIPADVLQAAADRLVSMMTSVLPGHTAFQPMIDGEVLLDRPTQSILAGHGRPVPLIIGSNEDEGSLFVMPGLPPMVPSIEPNLSDFMDAAYPGRAPGIRAAYAGHGRFGETIAMAGDGMVWKPSLGFADAVADHCPVYVYRFRWTSPPLMTMGLGSPHSIDVPFVFGVFEGGLVSVDGDASASSLSEMMQTAWTRFAHDHVPGCVGDILWPAYQPPRRATMILDRTIAVEGDPDETRRLSWSDEGG